MSDPGETILLSADDWRELQAAAAELDLVRGGYFRVRPDAIVFYCGPDNHPRGWDLPFTDGTPDCPRQLVGEAIAAGREGPEGTPEGAAGAVRVRLSVSNWAALRGVERARDAGRYTACPEQYLRDQQEALRGRPADRAWLLEQFQRLRRHAAGDLVEG